MASESILVINPANLPRSETTISSYIQFSSEVGFTSFYPQLLLSYASFSERPQHTTYEIHMAVGGLLERLSSKLGLRIKPEAEALIEEMVRAGELNLDRFSQKISTLTESLREVLPDLNYSTSIEAFEDPEVEGWRALVIRFEIDSTDFNELESIWNSLIEVSSKLFEEEGRRIYVSVRPRLKGYGGSS